MSGNVRELDETALINIFHQKGVNTQNRTIEDNFKSGRMALFLSSLS